jgi:hypothetical protein
MEHRTPVALVILERFQDPNIVGNPGSFEQFVALAAQIEGANLLANLVSLASCHS